MFPDEEEEIKVLKRLLDSFTALTRPQALIMSALLKNRYCTDGELSAADTCIRRAVLSINNKLSRASAGLFIVSFTVPGSKERGNAVIARMLVKDKGLE